MSQPTAYSKTTNFSQEEANNVGGRSTVRASMVDAELSNIETTLDQTLANLALIQRDDGKLRDGLVELYNLSPSTRLIVGLDIVPRGAWVQDRAYALNDLVEQDSASYVCVQAHTSTTFAADHSASRWLILAGNGGVFQQSGTGALSRNSQDKLRELEYSSADVSTPQGGTTDDGAKFTQALADSPAGLRLKAGTFTVDSTVIATAFKDVIGEGKQTIVRTKTDALDAAGQTLASPSVSTLFKLNTDGTTWPFAFPSVLASKVGDLFVQADKAGGRGDKVTAFEFAGSQHFHDIHAGGVQTLIKQTVGLYCDQVKIERISTYAQPDASSYIIDLQWTGDAVVIDQAQFYRTLDQANPGAATRARGIRCNYKNGLTISNIIGGDIFIDTCNTVDMSSLHMEDGIVTWRQSSGTLRNAVFYMRADTLGELSTTPLVFDYGAVSATIDTGAVSTENVQFLYEQDFSGGGYTITKPNFSVKQSPNAYTGVLKFSNVVRAWKLRGTDSGYGAHYGASCGMSDFDNYSQYASVSSRYEFNQWMISTAQTDLPTASTVLNAASGLTDAAQWQGSAGTYFYKAQFLYDKKRMLGLTGSSEVSLTPSVGGNSPTLILETDVRFSGMVRVYRGTATGSYTSYVDVPVVSAVRLVDTGNDIAGYPWIARTASGVDAINAFSPVAYYLQPGERSTATNNSDAYGKVQVWLRGNATIPTAGAWRRGDEVRLSSPLDDGSRRMVGWLRLTSCTAAAPAHVSNVDWCEMWVQYRPAAEASTVFLSATSTLNTVGKLIGKPVWDSTTQKPLYAAGPSATSVWKDATGTTVYTPV
jgi:hypothetical protein